MWPYKHNYSDGSQVVIHVYTGRNTPVVMVFQLVFILYFVVTKAALLFMLPALTFDTNKYSAPRI